MRNSVTYIKLENVAINDVLPLKAARRDAIANLKCFGAADTRDLTSMVTFTFKRQDVYQLSHDCENSVATSHRERKKRKDEEKEEKDHCRAAMY